MAVGESRFARYVGMLMLDAVPNAALSGCANVSAAATAAFQGFTVITHKRSKLEVDSIEACKERSIRGAKW